MGSNTSIEWTDHTLNLWWGCKKVHAGCDHCYAEAMDKRFSAGKHWGGEVRRWIPNAIQNVARWDRAAREAGVRARVFVMSMGDLMDADLPAISIGRQKSTKRPSRFKRVGTVAWGPSTGELRQELFDVIPTTTNLDFQILTKRPGQIVKVIPASWLEDPPNMVMWGVSASNQETADAMIPPLLQTPAHLRFLSLEPLLGPIALSPYDMYAPADMKPTGKFRTYEGKRQLQVCVKRGAKPLINWVIVGAETGQGARPIKVDWVRSLRDQCVGADIPFFFKQWGTAMPKEVGRSLDGIEWNEQPK